MGDKDLLNSQHPDPAADQTAQPATTSEPTSPVQAPTPENISDIPKNKSSKKLFKILVALILLILLAVVAVLAYQNYQLKNQIQTPTTTPQPTQSPPSPTPDPTADWETFKNSANYFELKYPKDWKAIEQEDYIYMVRIQSPNILNNDKITYSSSPIPTAIFEIYLSPEKNVTLEQIKKTLLQPLDTRGSVSNIEETQISGKPAVKYVETGNGLDEEPFTTIQIPTSTSTINISLKNYGNDLEEQNILDQILSTFRFIDTNPTIEWKTYTNDKYGFVFKYPNRWSEIKPTNEAYPEGYIVIGGDTKEELLHINVIPFSGDTSDLLAKYQKNNSLFSSINWGELGNMKSQKEINNLDVIWFEKNGTAESSEVEAGLKTNNILFTNGQLGFLINTQVNNEDELNQILSTFEFTK